MSIKRKPEAPSAPADSKPEAGGPPELRFLKSATSLMAGLPGLLLGGENSADLDTAVNTALEQVGQLTAVSRAYVMLDEENGRFLRNTHEWVNRDVGPAISSWPLHDYQRDLPSLKPLMAGRPFLAAHTRDLPPDFKSVLEKQAVDSVLLAPLTRHGSWVGLAGFDMCGMTREWSGLETDLLRHLAGLVPPALERAEYLVLRQCLAGVRAALDPTGPPAGAAPPDGGAEALTLAEAERRLIAAALARHHGNRNAAAKELGLPWAALNRRCKKLGLEVKPLP